MSATTLLMGLFCTLVFAIVSRGGLAWKCFQFFGAFGIFTLIYCVISAMQLNRAGVYVYGMLFVVSLLIAAGIYVKKVGAWYE